MKVYLGGTSNSSSWRDYVIANLQIEHFDPTAIAEQQDTHQQQQYERRHCDFLLHVITPKEVDFYSIAEAADDALKRPDRSIFCYLREDGGEEFDEKALQSLENVGWRVEKNGAIWLKSLDEVVAYLNAAKKQAEDFDLTEDESIDAFICYGRKNSRAFVLQLHQGLQAKGYYSWYDDGLVPLEIGNLDKVNRLIESAHNFIFVISSHSVRSEYSLRELEYAMKLQKRIIPIVHQQPEAYWENVPAEIRNGKMRYFISQAKMPEMVEDVIGQIEHERAYVNKHTELLNAALTWQSKGRTPDLLLYGIPRREAVRWMKTNFQNTVPPVLPAPIQRSYIEASEALSLSKQLSFFLDKITSFLTRKSWFDGFIGLVSLANPISLLPQLFNVFYHQEGLESISEYTFGLFAFLNLCFALVGIKQRNLGIGISMLLSMVINIIIVSIKLIYS